MVAASAEQQQQQQQQKQAAPAKKKKSKAASVLSGSLSGALVSACVQPLDVIRTRMQADMAHGVVRSTLQTMQTIMGEGGVRTLWKGTQPTVIRLGLGAGLHFFFLETIKPMFETQQADGSMGLGAVGAMVTGGLSRTAAAVAACPFTIIKTRMEYSGVGGHAYTGTMHALTSIWRAEGLRGMYRGLGPTALSQAPFSALYYMFYTRLQAQLKTAGERPSVGVNFVSGTVAAVAATVLTQPADVIRTRIQLNLAAAGAGTAAATAGMGAAAVGTAAAAAAAAAAGGPTSMQIFRHIVADQGLRGLMSGAAPRIVKRTLQTALLWTLYEELLPALTKAGEMLKARTEGSGSGSSSSSDSSSGASRSGKAA